ncbi:unnamed protein product [Pleuronectes platessa]|uniref:Uncharacterized protein n=1 Tax=Pleuronectes platessa TaxID=8262 RepID=A0A9N7YJV8_PLEPL|nr:unnamed protein product [Pleuronectes platessa]
MGGAEVLKSDWTQKFPCPLVTIPECGPLKPPSPPVGGPPSRTRCVPALRLRYVLWSSRRLLRKGHRRNVILKDTQVPRCGDSNHRSAHLPMQPGFSNKVRGYRLYGPAAVR